MLKRYLEKLISFGCSLQDVPRVDVVYEMPESQNYHLVKYISGKQGCLYVDIDAFKKEDQKSLFALFTELRRYYQDYTNMEQPPDLEYVIDANAFAVVVYEGLLRWYSPVNHDLPMTRVMLASHRLSTTIKYQVKRVAVATLFLRIVRICFFSY